jgi:hypothetical protein
MFRAGMQLLSYLLLIFAGVTALAYVIAGVCVPVVAGNPAVSGVPLVPCVSHCYSLPCYCCCPCCQSVPAVAFDPAVAAVPSVVGVTAVAIILGVTNIPADPGVHIFAGIFM